MPMNNAVMNASNLSAVATEKPPKGSAGPLSPALPTPPVAAESQTSKHVATKFPKCVEGADGCHDGPDKVENWSDPNY